MYNRYMQIAEEMLHGKKLRFLLVVLFCLGILAIVSGISSVLRKTPPTDIRKETATTPSLPSLSPTPAPYPVAVFSSYQFNDQQPDRTHPIQQFMFKTNITREDALELATKLGMGYKDIEQIAELFIITDATDKKSLNVDQKSGTFYFYSNNGILLQTTLESQDPLVLAKSFLKQVHLDEESIACTHWYKLQDLPEFTLVECHRAWDMVGYPIINAFGAMNLPSGVRLTNMHIGEAYPNGPIDTNVINTSDNTQGLKRPNDFNTYTIALDGESKLRAITSSMRIISTTTQISPEQILSEQEAEQELQNHKDKFTLVWPAGSGQVDMSKVFQNNTAPAEKAVVTDFILAYVEKPISVEQTTMELSYIFKGKARLLNGYDVQFLDVVPAIRGSKAVLGVSTKLAKSKWNLCGEGKAIQYCTFGDLFSPEDTVAPTFPPTPTIVLPTSTPIPTPIPPTKVFIQVTPTPQSTPPPQPPTSCPEFTGEYVLPSGDHIGYGVDGWMYYLPPRGQVIKSLSDLPERFNSCISKTDAIQAVRDSYWFTFLRQCVVDQIMQQNDISLGKAIRGLCTNNPAVCIDPQSLGKPQDCIMISLGSPSIYVYDNASRHISINFPKAVKVSYSYPSINDQSWTFETAPAGKIHISNQIFDRLYYEFDKKDALELLKKKLNSKVGFSIPMDTIEDFLKNSFAPQYGLAQQETYDLIQEIQRESTLFTKKYLVLRIIPEALLDEYLPINISPRPDTFLRLHVFIDQTDTPQILIKPQSTSLQRKGLTVIETGVLAE